MTQGGGILDRENAPLSDVMQDGGGEEHIQPPFTTAFTSPSHVMTTPKGRRDYSPSSSFWDDERILEAKYVPANKRRNVPANMRRSLDEGARIGGSSITPRKSAADEVSYDVERCLPVPHANAYPLVDGVDPSARFFRFTQVSHYNRGPDINFSSVGPNMAPGSDEVLANLDRVTMLEAWPSGFSSDRYAEFLERPAPMALRACGGAPTMLEFPRWSSKNQRGVPFNDTYVDRNDPEIQAYSDNRLRMDLTRDFGRFFPSFPYVAKDHPNRYFNDVETHLQTLHPVWGLYGNDTLARGWNAFA